MKDFGVLEDLTGEIFFKCLFLGKNCLLEKQEKNEIDKNIFWNYMDFGRTKSFLQIVLEKIDSKLENGLFQKTSLLWESRVLRNIIY